jgi:hypothetical protein
MRTKIYITLLSVIILAMPMEAQLIRSIGVKVGAANAGQSWHYSTPNISFAEQYRWGYSFGGYVEWLNIPVFSIVTEVHYIQKGFKQGFDRRDNDGNLIGVFYVMPQIDYLSIPVLLKIRYDVFPLAPYLLIGPRYEHLLKTKPDGTDIVLNNLKKSDFGITIGGGLDISSIALLKIGIEFRYSPGLTDIYSNQYGLTIQNRSFELLLAIGF